MKLFLALRFLIFVFFFIPSIRANSDEITCTNPKIDYVSSEVLSAAPEKYLGKTINLVGIYYFGFPSGYVVFDTEQYLRLLRGMGNNKPNGIAVNLISHMQKFDSKDKRKLALNQYANLDGTIVNVRGVFNRKSDSHSGSSLDVIDGVIAIRACSKIEE